MNLIEVITAVQGQVEQQFSSLTHQQLNCKTEPGKWSIAQCLQHLILANSNYFSTFDKVLEGNYKLSLFQRLNPFKRLVGSYMVKQLGPRIKKKMKAPAIFQPSYSELPADIVLNFSEMQNKLKEY